MFKQVGYLSIYLSIHFLIDCIAFNKLKNVKTSLLKTSNYNPNQKHSIF